MSIVALAPVSTPLPFLVAPADPDPAVCYRCDGDGRVKGQPCVVCGGIGEIITRNQLAHHFISRQFPENGNAPYMLPLVREVETLNPNWLADLIRHATDVTSEPLSVEQLVQVFDDIALYSTTYEAGARYWHRAARVCILLINQQLEAALPEVIA